MYPSLTENQIIAVLGTFAILLLTYLMSGIRTLFTTGSSLALIVFTVLLLVISLLVGLNSKSLSLGCMVFVLGGAVLLALFKLKSAALTTAFSGRWAVCPSLIPSRTSWVTCSASPPSCIICRLQACSCF